MLAKQLSLSFGINDVQIASDKQRVLHGVNIVQMNDVVGDMKAEQTLFEFVQTDEFKKFSASVDSILEQAMRQINKEFVGLFGGNTLLQTAS